MSEEPRTLDLNAIREHNQALAVEYPGGSSWLVMELVSEVERLIGENERLRVALNDIEHAIIGHAARVRQAIEDREPNEVEQELQAAIEALAEQSP